MTHYNLPITTDDLSIAMPITMGNHINLATCITLYPMNYPKLLWMNFQLKPLNWGHEILRS